MVQLSINMKFTYKHITKYYTETTEYNISKDNKITKQTNKIIK